MEWFQSPFSIFSALGGQNAPRIAGKTHMVWANLTQRGDPRAHFFILTPPYTLYSSEFCAKLPLKPRLQICEVPGVWFVVCVSFLAHLRHRCRHHKRLHLRRESYPQSCLNDFLIVEVRRKLLLRPPPECFADSTLPFVPYCSVLQ